LTGKGKGKRGGKKRRECKREWSTPYVDQKVAKTPSHLEIIATLLKRTTSVKVKVFEKKNWERESEEKGSKGRGKQRAW